MTRSEHYENIDKIISKERKEKKESSSKGGEEKDKNLKGGSDFVCSIDCKTCGAT